MPSLNVTAKQITCCCCFLCSAALEQSDFDKVRGWEFQRWSVETLLHVYSFLDQETDLLLQKLHQGQEFNRQI